MNPSEDIHEPASPDLAADDRRSVWNRRRFEDELDRHFARSLGEGETIGLLSIDVDGYRDVIQRHGAIAAEGLIRSISDVLVSRLGPNQMLARMGGDEFEAALPGATAHVVWALADDLCTAVREHSHAVGCARVHATISIGCVVLDPGTLTHHDAQVAADTALHKAKAQGGDRAILHEPSQGE